MGEYQKDSMIIYRSFYEAIKSLDDASRLKMYEAIFELGLNFNETKLDGVAGAFFTLIKPQIEANNRKAIAGIENGNKGKVFGKTGGRPKKEKPSNNPQQNPQETLNEPTNVNANANVNVNSNENENVNKNEIEKKTKKKKPELIPFIESIYNENFEQFDIDFSKTKTAIENPMIDKKKLFDTLQFSEPAKHRYSNWISAAQNWYKNYPSKYAFSLTSILEKDPAYAMMTKGQQVIAQNNLKMEMQKQFIKPNQDDDLPF